MGVTGTAIAIGVASAAAGAVISSVLAPSPKTPTLPAAPVASTPTTMPTTDSSAVQAAQTKALQDQIATRGRASTILSQTGTTDKLGG